MLKLIHEDYPIAEFLVDGNPTTDLSEIFNEKTDFLYEGLMNEVVVHLLCSAAIDGSTDGRSEQVAKAIRWDEYNNGSASDRERVTKEIKACLHQLYKARFIKKDRDGNVFLCSSIHINRHYRQLANVMHITITSCYEDGEFKLYEHHILHVGNTDDVPGGVYDDDVNFLSVRKLGPISRLMVAAQRLGDQCARDEFHDKDVVDMVVKAGWLNEYNGQLRMVGTMQVLEIPEEHKYLLEYSMGDEPWDTQI